MRTHRYFCRCRKTDALSLGDSLEREKEREGKKRKLKIRCRGCRYGRVAVVVVIIVFVFDEHDVKHVRLGFFATFLSVGSCMLCVCGVML